MSLPNWIGIPGVLLLIGVIWYGFRQGSKVTTKPDNPPSDPTLVAMTSSSRLPRAAIHSPMIVSEMPMFGRM